MATGDTAPPIALSSSPPPPLLDRSPSNLSSPLSDVEDKDAEPDEMDLDTPIRDTVRVSTIEQVNPDQDDDSASRADSDSDSKLSEVDMNDSEAETERLYDTPRKNGSTREGVNGSRAPGGQQFVDRRERTFERSPSKLQQQIQADVDAENEASDSEPLSDADDDASMASNEAEADLAKEADSRSPTPVKKKTQAAGKDGAKSTDARREDSADSRKRKRSPVAEQSETEQPRRKRTGSIDRDFSADDTAALEDEGGSINPQSGEHSGDEAEATRRGDDKDEAVSTEDAASGSTRSRKPKRNGVKKRNISDERRGHDGSAIESGQDDGDTATAEEDGTRAAEEDIADADADEEAEAAHKNEEERMCAPHSSSSELLLTCSTVERKKAAWEELAAIEKQFSSFRERYVPHCTN
jgi:hypothetical protein